MRSFRPRPLPTACSLSLGDSIKSGCLNGAQMLPIFHVKECRLIYINFSELWQLLLPLCVCVCVLRTLARLPPMKTHPEEITRIHDVFTFLLYFYFIFEATSPAYVISAGVIDSRFPLITLGGPGSAEDLCESATEHTFTEFRRICSYFS